MLLGVFNLPSRLTVGLCRALGKHTPQQAEQQCITM